MKELNPDTTWFTSDTHFSHKWVLETGMRSFTDVDEMDFRMIQTWNNTVKPSDVVYHLGDFAFAPQKKVSRILRELNGEIHLILGNHDFDKGSVRFNKRFKTVRMEDIIRIGDYRIVLNHFPLLGFPFHPNLLQFFGHVHSTPGEPRTADQRKLIHLHPTQFEVGADLHNLQPINFTAIIREIKERIKDYTPEH